jgi:predicted transcriptional regulator
MDSRTKQQLDRLTPEQREKALAAIARTQTSDYREQQRVIVERYEAMTGDVSTLPGFAPWGTMGDFVEFVAFLGRLKRERERLGLSLDDMARATGMDRMAISRLENGKNANPTVSTLVRYTNALGQSIAWRLIDESEAVKNQRTRSSE